LEGLTMAQEHDWQFDYQQSRPDLNISVSVCTNCGCIRIVHTDTFRVEYKPMEWTWNPFKTLKAEPACPAHW